MSKKVRDKRPQNESIEKTGAGAARIAFRLFLERNLNGGAGAELQGTRGGPPPPQSRVALAATSGGLGDVALRCRGWMGGAGAIAGVTPGLDSAVGMAKSG